MKRSISFLDFSGCHCAQRVSFYMWGKQFFPELFVEYTLVIFKICRKWDLIKLWSLFLNFKRFNFNYFELKFIFKKHLVFFLMKEYYECYQPEIFLTIYRFKNLYNMMGSRAVELFVRTSRVSRLVEDCEFLNLVFLFVNLLWFSDF